MPSPKLQFLQDKAVRDAAKSNLTSDVEHIRNVGSVQGWGRSIAGSTKDAASITAEGAIDYAEENQGQVAGILALAGTLAAAWIWRKPMLAALDTAVQLVSKAHAINNESSEEGEGPAEQDISLETQQ